MAIRGSWSNRLFSSTILGTFNCTPGPKLYMGVSCLVQQAKKLNPSESRGQHDHVQPALRLWSIWSNLTVLQHLFSLILCAVSAYSLFSATITIARLRSIENLNRNEDLVPIQRSVAALHTRCANVRQLIGATFYLFGLVFVLGLRSAPSISVLSTIPVGTRILQNFVLHFAFAANVYSIFLLLHLVQWFVRGRLNSSSLHFNSRYLA